MKKIMLTLVGLMLCSGIGHTQSLDELPDAVARISKAIVKQCTKAGGNAQYEPLELVTSVFFGSDFDGGGRDSFVIDGSKLRCKGGKANGRSACEGGECRLVVLNPTGESGYKVDFDGLVQGWGLAGDNAFNKGPNVNLELTIGGETYEYAIDGRGLNKLN